MEYLNRIMEADRKSKKIMDEFFEARATSYVDRQDETTFDEFNIDKSFVLQGKLQDLQTLIGYYERAYRNVDTMSLDQFTEIADYFKVEDVKEELNRRINHIKSFIDIQHHQL